MRLPSSTIAILLVLVACGAQPPPGETTSSLPGDEQERHSPRFVPEKAASEGAPISAPSNDSELAPGGSALDGAGTRVDLAAAYANNHVVLVFYRGHW